MLVPLTIIDGAVAEMDICCGFVYALPNGKDPLVAKTLIDNIEAATKRVVTKWPMLQGHPIWDKEVRKSPSPAWSTFEGKLVPLS